MTPSTAAYSGQSLPERVSGLGILGGICCLSLAASAFRNLRPEIGGLLLHPVNFPLALLLVAVVPRRIHRIPPRIWASLVTFCVLFSLAALVAPKGLNLTLKIAGSAAAFLVAATTIKNETDFRWAATGLAVAIAVISLRGLLGDVSSSSVAGINPMVGIANKNAFSVYALPSLLLSGFLILQDRTPKWSRILLIGCVLVTVLAIFSTANRSGWLGCVVVVGLLGLSGVQVRKAAVLFLVVAGAFYLVQSLGNLDVIEHRIEQTRDPMAAFRLRLELIEAAGSVGFSNPILGVSPQNLPRAMARLTGVRGADLASHNVFAMILGGGGLLVTLAFFLFGTSLWLRPRRIQGPWSRAKEAHFLLRAMMTLWCLRGMFSHEILYNPAFSLALGTCLGRCVLLGVWSHAEEPQVVGVHDAQGLEQAG